MTLDYTALALTVRQPWAWAIAHGPKDVENRTGGVGRWRRLAGCQLLIHAGAGWSDRGARDARLTSAWWYGQYLNPVPPPYRIFAGGQLEHRSINGVIPAQRIVFSAIIAVTTVVDVHQAEPGCCESTWAESEYTDVGGKLHTTITHLALGPRQALLDNGVACNGHLGLWHPRAEVLAEVAEGLG